VVVQQEASKMRQTFQNRRLSRFKRFAVLVGALTASVFFSCSSKTEIKDSKAAVTAPKPPTSQPIGKTVKMRCYDYGSGELRVYIENQTKDTPDEQLGFEKKLLFSELGIENGKTNTEPLAYFCTHAGYLFWVTSDIVYIKRISIEENRLRVDKVLEIRHTEPDEYAVPGVKVVSADVWCNPKEHWEKITIATLTNTGLFQASQYSLKALVENKPERAIYNFKDENKLQPENRWPENGVSTGLVRVLDDVSFSVIPLGERGKGRVRNFYYIAFEGKQEESIRSRPLSVFTLRPWKKNPGLKNIFEMSKPIRYDKRLGGWVVNLTGEKQDGRILPLFPIVTPEEKD